MKRQSLIITRFGGPEVFSLVEQESQPLKPEGVRIQVKASGINFADLMMRIGAYPEAPKLPFAPGYEVAGVVTEVGSAVRTLRKGERVMAGCKFGGYTTEIVVPEFQVRKIPERLSDAEAASIPVNFATAWVALQDMGRVRKGDRVLIQSAAGGVGLAAVQIAARAGAYVVGLVGSPSKAATVKKFGAQEILTNEEWESGKDEALGGFSIILDPTGGASLKRSFRRLAAGGCVVNFGASSIVVGEKRSLLKALGFLAQTPLFTPFKLMMENKGVYGLNMLQLFDPPSKSNQDPKESLMGHALTEVCSLFEKGELQAVVGKTFPLAQGGEAHRYLQSRQNIGKVVLSCDG